MIPKPPAQPSAPPGPPGTGGSTLFQDEFSGSSVDTSKWTVLKRPGDASNSDLQCYTPNNVSEGGGILDLHTMVDSSCSGYSYTSGAVQSNFNFTYGTLEVRAKFPGGQGPWPAIWMLGADCQASNITTADNIGTCAWPTTGSQEIDVAEKVCGNTCVNQNVFWGPTPNNPTQTPCHADGLSDITTNFHIYTMIWSPGSLVFKIDGVNTCTLTQYVPDKPMFLILNTAVGGAGGAVSNATLPQDFQIDYVRVTTR